MSLPKLDHAYQKSFFKEMIVFPFPPTFDEVKGPKPLPSGNMNKPPRPPKAPPVSGFQQPDMPERPDKEKYRQFTKDVIARDIPAHFSTRRRGPLDGKRPPRVPEKYKKEKVREVIAKD